MFSIVVKLKTQLILLTNQQLSIKIIEKLDGEFDCGSIGELNRCHILNIFQKKNVQLTVVDNQDEMIKLKQD